MQQVISMWSGPRNISTALMYAFAQRSDTLAFDEPLYAHYLSKIDHIQHPGQAEVLATMEQDGNKVMQTFLTTEYAKPIVFLKQMSHHLIHLKEDFLGKMKHILLIRDPYEVILSFSKVISNPTLQDIGIQQAYEIHQKLATLGQTPPVLDGKELLLNPPKVLQKLCVALDIPFEKNMLSWPAGPKKEDGCWAKYWYKGVHQSTGFKAYTPKTEALPEHLLPLLEKAQPYYEALQEIAISTSL